MSQGPVVPAVNSYKAVYNIRDDSDLDEKSSRFETFEWFCFMHRGGSDFYGAP